MSKKIMVELEVDELLFLFRSYKEVAEDLDKELAEAKEEIEKLNEAKRVVSELMKEATK